MVQVIINADDFGLTPGVNSAICKLFENGVIGSTSALACSRFIEEGLEKLQTRYHKNVGLHVCLDEERPISDPKKITTLINPKSDMFKPRLEFVRDLFLRKISINDLYIEIRAQFERLIDLGIKPDHIDSHGHLHIFPVVADVIAQIGKEFGIIRIRKPIETYLLKLLTIKNLDRLPAASIIKQLSKRAFKEGYKQFITTDSFMGILDSGRINNLVIRNWIKILNNFSNKTIELMCHPGLEKDRELIHYRHWKYNWQSEYELLQELKNYIDTKKDIRLTNFKDLNI